MTLFPALSPEEVRERVEKAWRIADGRFPLPRWDVRCPAAPATALPDSPDVHVDGYEVQLSRIHYGKRKGSATIYRADVVLKCTACSVVWTHGVPIEREVYERALKDHGNTWNWREVREALQGAPLT